MQVSKGFRPNNQDPLVSAVAAANPHTIVVIESGGPVPLLRTYRMHVCPVRGVRAADTPQLLLEHHLKELRLPTILREYDKVTIESGADERFPQVQPSRSTVAKG